MFPHPSGAPAAWEPIDPSTRALLGRIAAEYREMPGLNLTAAQASRLFGIDRASCDAALDALVSGGRLHRSPDGRYYAAGALRRAS